MKKLKELFNQLFSVISESIRRKLLFALVILAIAPLITLGVYSYYQSSQALREKAEDNLTAIAETRINAIRRHIQNRYSDMSILHETVKTLRNKAFNQLASMQQLKKSLVETYFTERMSDVNVMSRAPIMSRVMDGFSKIRGPVGGDSWKQVEKRYGSYLVQFAESYGYYDAYIISPGGTILYTVAQESDLGENLLDGELKDSPAGKAFRRGMKEIVFQDFEPYEPAYGAPAAFIAAPIRSGNDILGVVMVQASIDQINFIMQERTGLGRTGESYLVGEDLMFRSDSIHVAESTIMNPAFRVESEGAQKALQGETGQGIIRNFRNEYVLASWTPIRIQDLTWAMISEIDVTEAFIPQGEAGEEDFFTKFKEDYGYGNLSLVNPDGFMFYSVDKTIKDYRTNLLTGEYKDTNLGELLGKVISTKIMGLTDYRKYEPMGNKNAAFVAVPVLSDKKEVEVVAVAQLSTKENNDVMADDTGLGDTGATYLVGKDRLLRSESKFHKNSVMNPKLKVDTEPVREALAGNTGMGVRTDYRGEKVLTRWMPFQLVPKTPIHPEGINWAMIAQIDMSEVRAPALAMALVIAGGVFIVCLLVMGGYIVLSRGLTVQLDHIMDLFSEIGMGNFSARTPVTTQDELGTMASSLNAMLDNTMALIESSEERDAMQGSIMQLLEEISGLADGDLTARAEVTEDFTGAIADSFNDMAEQLGEVVRTVKTVTLQVSTTSKDVRSSTENLAETSEMQAVQVSDAIAAINEMAASIQQVAENASRSSEVSEQSKLHSKEGAEAVRATNDAMESIREHVQETARAIKRLGESSQEVGNIVQLINDIADRTSILALNASIQAAMAGDAGRGFAVVAEEVQRLAERSTNATKQIDTLIKNIQGEINEAGSSMEESIQRVVEGSKLADNAYDKLQEIENVTVQLSELIQSISMASRQQARASENIAKTMEEVGDISAQTSAASRQTAVSMKNLAETSDELNNSVSVFKLAEDVAEDAEEPDMEGAGAN